ncbi:MAG TPA: polysaccharide biosynthesis tyrosine autokinase [Tepidisphaeraceae bacterium]|nr:polysaccharide biosynthesis tyrosine autokinase [Tepidisphaeraceae bacterium]
MQRALPSNQLAMPGPSGLVVGQPSPANTGMSAADVWRVVRANFWLIVIMLIVSGAAGYGINMWLAAHYSKYTATGYVAVHLPGDRNTGASMDNSSPVVNTAELEVEQVSQARLLLHERLLSKILDTSDPIRQTEWFKQFVYYRDGTQKVDLAAAKSDLLDHFDVAAIPSSRLILVKMAYSVPKDCQTIVREIVEQHIKDQKEITSLVDIEHSQALEQLKLNYESQIRDINARMLRIATDLGAVGVGIGAGPDSKTYELQQLLSEQLRAVAVWGAAQAKLKTFDEQMQTNSAPELEEALQKSPLYTEYRHDVDELELSYADLVSTLGSKHQRSMALKHRLDAMEQKLSDTENDIKSRTAELIRANLVNDATAADAARKRVDERIDEVRTDISRLAKMRNEYDHLQGDLTNLRSQLDRVKDQQDRLGFLIGTGKWSPVEWATLPDLPDRPTFPVLWKVLTVALVSGLALSLGIAFLRELTDTTIRTPRDVARIGQLTLLGMIPHENDDPEAAGARLPLAIFEAPHSIIAEQFRQVRTRLQHTASLDTTRSILVTGCSPEDGKTTVACNLAAGLALNGRRILLVDANFRRPSLHNVFGTSNEVGFGDVLNDMDTFQDAVTETEVPNLSLITSGAKPSNPTELLESQLLIDFIERALEEYDHVIFDSGPLLMVSDSIALAPRVDGVVTVVRARGNSRGMLTRMRDELRRLKAEHLGVVLNAVRVHGGGYYGPMIKNYYAYQNG